MPDWVNSDILEAPGIVSCDILNGLPFDEEWFDYVVSIHALPELTYQDLVPVLRELRRVLKPGGILRLGLPDLDLAVDAYRQGDTSYFVVPDEDARSVGAKFVTQMLWYGYSKSLFNYQFAEELLYKSGYLQIARCAFRETRCPFPKIIELDNRPTESFFVEAVKPEGGT